METTGMLSNFTVLDYVDSVTLNNTDVYSVSVPDWSDSTQTATLRFYDIFIPLFGSFIILLNLAVVINSGLIVRRGEF